MKKWAIIMENTNLGIPHNDIFLIINEKLIVDVFWVVLLNIRLKFAIFQVSNFVHLLEKSQF